MPKRPRGTDLPDMSRSWDELQAAVSLRPLLWFFVSDEKLVVGDDANADTRVDEL